MSNSTPFSRRYHRRACLVRIGSSLSFGLALAACSPADVGGFSRGDDTVGASDQSEGDKAGERNEQRDGPTRVPDDQAEDSPPPPPDTGPRDDESKQCAAIRKDAPVGKGAVDIVFLIDTSGSMLHALTQVQQNIARFVQSFENTTTDTRVVMITASDPAAGSPLAANSERYRFIASPVDSRALYGVALARYNDYQPFLRSESTLQFVMVTDDNDRMPADTFKREMEARLGRPFIQHAIASESVNGLPCISEAQLWNPLCAAPIPAICAAAAVGDAYNTLADQTAGAKMSICKSDWTSVFAELKKAVIEAIPLPCKYPLADASDRKFDVEQVSVAYAISGKDEEFPKALTRDRCIDRVGWYYDDNDDPANIELCPAACDAVQQGGEIEIIFGCEPTLFL